MNMSTVIIQNSEREECEECPVMVDSPIMKNIEEATAITLSTVEIETQSLTSTIPSLASLTPTTKEPLVTKFVDTTENSNALNININVNNNVNNNVNVDVEKRNTHKSRQLIIPVLEAEGGTDKNEEGHRRDTMPIQQALQAAGARCVVFQFREEFATVPNKLGESEAEVSRKNYEARAHNDSLRSSLLQTLDDLSLDGGSDTCIPLVTGLVVRNNPGSLSVATQAKFDAMLIELHELGVVVMNHPIVQKNMGAKDSLCKIRDLKCGLLDTDVYYDADAFQEGFRKSIAFQPRVIKQNRGSQGEGIWICKLKNENEYCKVFGEKQASLDTELVLIEASDNHVEEHTVGSFLEFCVNGRTEKSGEWVTSSSGKYLEGGVESGAMLIDQRFLPRIMEGEVRCVMVGPKLVELIHKVPQNGGISATLQSGAKYTKYSPDDPKFANLVANFKADLPHIMKAFGLDEYPLPLLWTADYIFGEKDENGKDTFCVGEFNCTCVGITQQLHICDTIAMQAVNNCHKYRR